MDTPWIQEQGQKYIHPQISTKPFNNYSPPQVASIMAGPDDTKVTSMDLGELQRPHAPKADWSAKERGEYGLDYV